MEGQIFLQLMKVDEERREVYGRATQEVVDKSQEIFDYATSKPYFKAWSEKCSTDTGGKSLGNIRSMHGKVCAGKLNRIDFNDAEKAIDIVAKIVDDNEWNKVKEGCYTGFSIGGSYKKKWNDSKTKAVRFTADPYEISLVDLPCVPTAKFFDVVKADGATEQVPFKKYEGEEVYDASCALDALRSVMYLICKESNENEDEAAQVAMLREAAQKLKQFIAAEIMEDHAETVEAAMAMFAHGMPMDEIKKNLQKIKTRKSVGDQHATKAIVAIGKKSDLSTPPSAVDRMEGSDMDSETINKAAERLERALEQFEKLAPTEVKKADEEPKTDEVLLKRLDDLEKEIKILKSQPVPLTGDSVMREMLKGSDSTDAIKAAIVAPKTVTEAQDLVFGTRQ